jgi:hypothetical protein
MPASTQTTQRTQINKIKKLKSSTSSPAGNTMTGIISLFMFASDFSFQPWIQEHIKEYKPPQSKPNSILQANY